MTNAPWTDEQVARLNDEQLRGRFHPFTCANRDRDTHPQRPGERDFGLLVATADGWICRDCDYTQGWAHDWMVIQDPGMDALHQGVVADDKPDLDSLPFIHCPGCGQSIHVDVEAIGATAREDEKHKADLAITFWELEVEGLRAKLKAARTELDERRTALNTAHEQVARAEVTTAGLVSVVVRQERALTEWEDMKQWFDTWSEAAERDGSYRMDVPLYRDALRMVDDLVRMIEAQPPLLDLDYGPVETVRFVEAPPEDDDV